MTAGHMVTPARLLGQALSDASPDLMRELLATTINAPAATAAAITIPTPTMATADSARPRDAILHTRSGTHACRSCNWGSRRAEHPAMVANSSAS